MTPESAQAEGLLNASLKNNLSSVELSHNSKGNTWSIKGYSENIQEAKKQVEEIHADFVRKYGIQQ